MEAFCGVGDGSIGAIKLKLLGQMNGLSSSAGNHKYFWYN
jgi:hypothetical protein